MPLPVPNLDDRHFQQLVDDAKRLVQQRCPEWTDHNVSDPGVTLIEAFAQMVDQLIYRLNRVPDRHYVKFLDLIGVELRPPSAARGEVTFWLSAPQPQPVVVRAATEVATPRTDVEDPLVFTTDTDLEILPCTFAHAAVQATGAEAVDQTGALAFGEGFPCFSAEPVPGDSLLVGLSDAAPSCTVTLRLDCRIAGIGVDPRNPPLVWEAWNGRRWSPCDVERDETGGLNKPGDVVLHIPPGHQPSLLAHLRAGWLRCRVVEPTEGQPTYAESPRVTGVEAFTIGGTVGIVHAEVVRDELLGLSDGTPAQRFSLARRPTVPADVPEVLEVGAGDLRETWFPVENFARSGPDDPHFRVDAASGEVQFGPAVRLGDGSVRHYGSIPPKGAPIVMTSYRTGGGRRGNVAAGQIRVLKTSVPYVASVENRTAAAGGADAESVEDAKARGPMLLRTRGRAVTAEDFAELTREVAPEIARAQCIPAESSSEAGGVRLLVVPHVASDSLGRVRLPDLMPTPRTLSRITAYLDERRLIGTRLLVEPPEYHGLTVVVSVRARGALAPNDVQTDVQRALYRYLHPLEGGPMGTGWPFGRAVQVGEIFAVLAAVAGVDLAQETAVALYPADTATGRRGAPVQRFEVPPRGLVLSYEHQVQVRR
jgi:predicted phage baseplate assembly protein